MKSFLTNCVLQAQLNHRIDEDLKQVLIQKLYQYPISKLGANKGEEIASDFLLSVFEDLERAVMNFRYRGIPFENYLYRFMSLRLLTFLKHGQQRQYQRKFGEELDFAAGNADGVGSESSLQLLPRLLQGATKASLKASKKAILLFTLKYNQLIDPHGHQQICRLIGLNYFLFLKLQARLDKMGDKKRQARQRCQQKLNFHRHQVMYLQQQLHYAGQSSEPAKLSFHQHRLDLYRRRIRTLKTFPSNQQLATLLRMKKGSVDSLLFRLKKNLLKLESELKQEQERWNSS